ncbi:MAG: phytoene desaturase family protein [Acidobacteriota bacterium]
MSAPLSASRVLVVGAGLGGISAAVSLAQEGYGVTLVDKNDWLGGKLSELRTDGYVFDLGPSILTLPQFFERLFERSGKRMADYIPIVPVRPHWRCFFEDGVTVDLHPERQAMEAELRKVGEPAETFWRFLDYSAGLYDLTAEGYFEQGLDSAADFREFYGLLRFPGFDLLRSMHQGVRRHLRTRKMRDIMDFFIKYVGSSALRAPAFMNAMPTIQFRYDLWYAEGGMYNIARGLGRLLDELGVEVRLGVDVERLEKAGGRVTGALTRSGERLAADIVVSNLEVVPTYRHLLGEGPEFLRGLRRLEPSCSGLVIDLGLDRRYSQLAHHNFFFSRDQAKHFKTVFRKKQLPADPTIYLVAAARSDDSVAPPGCDSLKILPHIPHLDAERSLSRDDYLAYKDVILEKLERMGLEDLRRHVVVEHVLTPLDIEERYRSNRGSIYGVVADRFKNLGFKAPKQSERYENLFFVGGSVNPGGGMPMVTLCGQNVARKVVEFDQQ